MRLDGDNCEEPAGFVKLMTGHRLASPLRPPSSTSSSLGRQYSSTAEQTFFAAEEPEHLVIILPVQRSSEAKESVLCEHDRRGK